jgi:subtilase family serine protease
MHRADLIVTALTAPASVGTGQVLSVASTVKNVGPNAAPGFRVTFYLSAGDNRPGAGMPIGSRLLAGLGVAAASAATTPMTIPVGFEPGVYFLSAVVDDPNAVIEVDDRNNGLTANQSVTVVMHRADLIVTALAPASRSR